MRHAGVTRLDVAVLLLVLSVAAVLYVLNVELAARSMQRAERSAKVETSHAERLRDHMEACNAQWIPEARRPACMPPR